MGMDRESASFPFDRPRSASFLLTEAVRPAPGTGVQPSEGYRIQTYRSPDRPVRLPVLTASISRDRLLDVFLALLSPLGAVVDVILESTHDSDGTEPREAERESIDLPVLTSHCLEFEELLLNDGCTGIAVLNEDRRVEVHFDEHKLLYVYSPRLRPFELILSEFAIPPRDGLRILTEGEHIHCTQPRHAGLFEQFGHRLGVEQFAAEWN